MHDAAAGAGVVVAGVAGATAAGAGVVWAGAAGAETAGVGVFVAGVAGAEAAGAETVAVISTTAAEPLLGGLQLESASARLVNRPEIANAIPVKRVIFFMFNTHLP